MKLLDGPLGKTFAGVDRSGTLSGAQFSANFFVSAIVHQPTIAIRQTQIKNAPKPINPIKVAEETEAATLTTSLLCSSSCDFLNFFKLENIGVDCNPRCGSCICGNCAIGGKILSLKEEKEYEVIKGNLNYDAIGTKEDPGPYFRSVLPWKVDRSTLGNNKSVVLGTLNATLKKLKKNPT